MRTIQEVEAEIIRLLIYYEEKENHLSWYGDGYWRETCQLEEMLAFVRGERNTLFDTE